MTQVQYCHQLCFLRPQSLVERLHRRLHKKEQEHRRQRAAAAVLYSLLCLATLVLVGTASERRGRLPACRSMLAQTRLHEETVVVSVERLRVACVVVWAACGAVLVVPPRSPLSSCAVHAAGREKRRVSEGWLSGGSLFCAFEEAKCRGKASLCASSQPLREGENRL